MYVLPDLAGLIFKEEYEVTTGRGRVEVSCQEFTTWGWEEERNPPPLKKVLLPTRTALLLLEEDFLIKDGIYLGLPCSLASARSSRNQMGDCVKMKKVPLRERGR